MCANEAYVYDTSWVEYAYYQPVGAAFEPEDHPIFPDYAGSWVELLNSGR